jgi:hypothetical protein
MGSTGLFGVAVRDARRADQLPIDRIGQPGEAGLNGDRRTGPVDLVQVDRLEAQPPEALLKRSRQRTARQTPRVGEELAGDGDRAARLTDELPQEGSGCPGPVPFRGVEEIEPVAERSLERTANICL